MTIRHEPGDGQHTLVRIEHTSFPGSGVHRVEYEDSDLSPGDNTGSVGMCIRWALDALRNDNHVVLQDLSEALASLNDWLDMKACPDEQERKLIASLVAAAIQHTEYVENGVIEQAAPTT